MAANNSFGVTGVTTVSGTLNGLFKEVYASELVNLIPDGVKVLTKIPFSKRNLLGSSYHQPVILGHEHGVTFAASTEDAFTLQAAIAGQIQDAQVSGTQLVLRSVLGLAAASRSMAGGKVAFMDATKFLVGNMLRSVTKKLEIEMLYGQMGYATLAATLGSGDTVATIPAAQWAPGIWAGAEGMPVEIKDTTGATSRGTSTVLSVDFEARTVTLSSAITSVVSTDVIWHRYAYGKEFAGIHKILSNTGTLFGISAASYSLFKGNSYDSAGALSYTKIQNAIAKAVEKGLDNDVLVIVNPEVWADVLTDMSAQKYFDSSYSSAVAEKGSKEIKFHGQNGVIEIVPSIYCKLGFAYVISPEDYMRLGSTDVTFNRPGKDGEFFRDSDTVAGYELRCYTDQALFCAAPAKGCLITGITS